MSDLLLDRINAPAVGLDELEPFDWPKGLAPVPASRAEMADVKSTDPLPAADVIVWAYTAAEKQALAKVFTPGIEYTEWIRDRNGWDMFVPDLTWKSPAKDEGCLAYWWITRIGNTKVVVLGNNLHLATDSTALPLRRYWGQKITQAKPFLVVDTGTAGGVGAQMNVGDTVVATHLRFDCGHGAFASQQWAQQSFPTTASVPTDWTPALKLMAANASALRPQTMVPVKVVAGDVLTTSVFAEDTADDKFGLRAYDAAARAVEMDASVLGLVAQDLGAAMPAFTSLRSVSDPQMPAGASESAASDIYLKFGGPAQTVTNFAVWQTIIGMAPPL